MAEANESVNDKATSEIGEGRPGAHPGEKPAEPTTPPSEEKSKRPPKRRKPEDPTKRPSSAFAPRDYSDHRKLLDWKTKYPDQAAQRGIQLEAAYLAVMIAGLAALIYWMWPKTIVQSTPGGAPVLQPNPAITNLVLAWLGGTLGGTLFSTKWLYHSVAKQRWHEDRRLWRLFTPHLSGVLSFATFVTMISGLLPMIERKVIETEAMAVAIGFIVGYFSDTAVAKLSEVAETLFGSTRK
jgi:hypothetical protein